jgi:hypothetical protein
MTPAPWNSPEQPSLSVRRASQFNLTQKMGREITLGRDAYHSPPVLYASSWTLLQVDFMILLALKPILISNSISRPLDPFP